MQHDKPAYSFLIYEEQKKATKMKTFVKSSTSSRKVPYIREYELSKYKEEKTIIDEINRRNLTSDYGV